MTQGQKAVIMASGIIPKQTNVRCGTRKVIRMAIYGYCRISTARQNIERQIRNIKESYPTADIKQEIYTGTKTRGRKEWEKLLARIKPGDTIVFDSVSRMSRNAEEGFHTYQDLYNKDVNLVFLKEPAINTANYRDVLQSKIDITVNSGDGDTDKLMQSIIAALNEYVTALQRRQIFSAFEQSQKEVDDMRQRTKEGIETARRNGKQIGATPNRKLTTKRSIEAKEQIIKHSRDFNGTLNDADCMKLAGCSRNSYYKYKRELKEEN